MADSNGSAADRLALTFQLFDAGVAMMRLKLSREAPTASAAEIERRLNAWLASRPGAEDGDAPGRVVPWPRR